MPDLIGAPTLYSRLKAVCKGVLKDYTTDLTVHDRAICRAMVPGDVAMYAVRSAGTHFCTYRSADNTTTDAAARTAQFAVNYIDAINSVAPNARWFLVECTSPQRGNVASVPYSRAIATVTACRDQMRRETGRLAA